LRGGREGGEKNMELRWWKRGGRGGAGRGVTVIFDFM